MVTRVTGFQTQDGQVFESEKLALAHEKFLSLGAAVKAALVSLNVEGAAVNSADGVGICDLSAFLLAHSEVLVDALTPPKKERKPRAPKEPAPAADAVSASTPASLSTSTTDAAPAAETAAPVSGADAQAAAQAELDALLGAGTTSTPEVSV